MNHQAVEITAPDIEPYRLGNTGIAYATTFYSGAPGPRVLITALMHGNELSGAHVLAAMFERGIRPARGWLTLAYLNVDAYHRFDPQNPRASRYVDEDLNRVWQHSRLDGTERSCELDRAREIRPLVDEADFLLDLHSMQLPSEPLLLVGLPYKGRALARAMGYPACVVADCGHRNGTRMRDYGRFSDPHAAAAAILVECGHHWARTSVDVALVSCRQFLAVLGVVAPDDLDRLAPPAPVTTQRVVEVTEVVTVEEGPFTFVQDFKGLDRVAVAGTVIGHDGKRPVTTPYDDCVLVMPSHRLAPGLTAVRLGRFVP